MIWHLRHFARMMCAPAAERNKGPILDVLRRVIPNKPDVTVLEIASGSGQHVAHFSDNMPNVRWQPSECDFKSLDSIRGHVAQTRHQNVLEPIRIDTTELVEQWGNGVLLGTAFDVILCINMLHISDWSATQGLFAGCRLYLKPGGILVIYGPFKIKGEIYPESNIQFDQSLRQQNSNWGLRDTDDVGNLAEQSKIFFEEMVDMPANNRTLVFRRCEVE